MYLELKSIDYLELGGQEIRTRFAHFQPIGLRCWARASVNSFTITRVILFLHDFSMEKSTAFFGWQQYF